MVQIIGREPTAIEQLFSGLSKGVERGTEFAKMGYQAKQQKELLQQEFAGKKTLAEEEHKRKQNLATQFKQKFEEQGLDPQIAELLGAEMAGAVSGGSTKSAINALRESRGTPINDAINQILNGSSPTQNQDFGEQNEFSTQKPISNQRNKADSQIKDIEGKISQLRPLLTEGSPDQKKTISDTINFLQNERDFLFKQSEAEKNTTNIPQQEYYKHAAKENAAFLDEVGNIEKDLPNTSLALAGIEDALGSADKWAAARDIIADKTGFEGARSASGAELDSFIKNYFLGDLTSIKGGRPNVFIEKQIRDAYPKAGRDPIANQKVALGMKMKEELNRLLVDETRGLEKTYIENQDFLPPNFKAKVRESIKGKATEIEKKYIDTLHHISKIEEQRDKIFRKYVKPGEVLMMDEEGNPFAVPKKEVNDYKARNFIPLGEK